MKKTFKRLISFSMVAALTLSTLNFSGMTLADNSSVAKASAQVSKTTSGGAITAETTKDVYVPENPTEFKDMTSDEMIADMGNGWNLGNTLDGHDDAFNPAETKWQNIVTTKAFIKSVHDMGFNTLRLPVTWGTMINDDENYSINEEWMSRVQDIVEYAKEENMYVVVNIMHDGANNDCWLNLDADADAASGADKDKISTGSWEGVKTKYAGVWTTIASRFKNYDEHLIFEAMNEVYSVAKGGWTNDEANIKAAYKQINELNQIFVNTVRATGGNNDKRWLVSSTLNTNISNALTAKYGFQVPTDSANHMMVSVHDYDPYNAESANPAGTSYAGQFKKLKETFVDKGIPVLLGEYGFVKTSFPSVRASRFEGVNYLAQKYNIVVCAWDNNGESGGDGYRLLNRGYNKPYSAKCVAAIMRGRYKDTKQPEYIDAANYKDVVLTNLTSITPNKDAVSLKVGDTEKITCTEAPADNNDVILWSSDNGSVASAHNGKIVARGVGEATITATSMNARFANSKAVETTIKVTVTAADLSASTTAIKTDFDEYTLAKGNEGFLNAVSNSADNKSISYESSDDTIVNVSTMGKLSALKVGTAKVTAISSDGFKKEIVVNVEAKASDTPFKSDLGINVLYNSDSAQYFSTEKGAQTVSVDKNGQYTLEFDCATDLSAAAKTAGITNLNGAGAIYIKDRTTATKSEIQTGLIVYDSIEVNGTALTITDKTPKSIMNGKTVDTGDPFNVWDGSMVSEDDIQVTSGYELKFKNISDPKKVKITFTLSSLSAATDDDTFNKGTDVDDDDVKINGGDTPGGDTPGGDTPGGDTNQKPSTQTPVAKTTSLSAAAKTVVAAGKSKTVSYKATLASGATKLASVKATSNYSKVKVSVNEASKKLTFKVDKKAVKGKAATVTLSSDGAKDVKIKVYVKNATSKLTTSKKKVTVKKKKSTTLTVKVKAANKKYATTDTVKATSSKKAVAKVSSVSNKAGKIKIKVKALKKGTAKIKLTVGSKKTTVTVKVK